MDPRLSRAMTIGYGVVPLAAGADKFACLLTDWEKYLSRRVSKRLPVSPSTFMKAVGVVEMAVGAAVLTPRLRKYGAWLAGGWLTCIAIQMAIHEDKYLDIAARDALLALGAVVLAAEAAPVAIQPRQQVLAAAEEVVPGWPNVDGPKPSVHLEH